MRRRTNGWLLAAWLGICPALCAADAQVTASLDRGAVAAGEGFRLVLNVSGAGGDVGNPEFPRLPAVEYHGGSRSQNMQIVNGVVSSSVALSFTVVCHQPGKLVLTGIRVPVDGRMVAVNPLEITVTPAAPQRPGAQASGTDPAAFVVSSVSKRVVHVGEQLVHFFRLNYRVRFASQPQYAPPNFAGFITEGLDANPRPDRNGYAAVEVRTALFPTAPGTYTIPAASLQVVLLETNSGDPFAAFFGGGRTVQLKSEPIQITVKPLPDAGRPAGFTGAVGSYRLTAALDKRTVEAGKPVTLTMDLSGQGLIKSLKEPALPDIPGIRRYETITALSTKAQGDAITGTKTFKVMLIPTTSGKVTIPAIKYPVFNPVQGRYETLSSGQLVLAVTGATSGPALAGPTGTDAPAGAGIRTVHEDIRFLKSVTAPRSAAPAPWTNGGMVAAQAVPVVFLCAGLLLAWRRDAVSRDPAKERARRARSNALRRLLDAHRAARSADPVAVHQAVQQALAEYLAARWNVSPTGLTLTIIRERLRGAGLPDRIVETLAGFWEEADLIRYAPQAATATDLAQRLHDTGVLLTDLEPWT